MRRSDSSVFWKVLESLCVSDFLGLWLGEKSCPDDAHHHRPRWGTHCSLSLQPRSGGLFHFLSFVFFNKKNNGFSKRLSIGYGNENAAFMYRLRFRTLCATLFSTRLERTSLKKGWCMLALSKKRQMYLFLLLFCEVWHSFPPSEQF